MANTTGSDKIQFTPWTTDRVLRLPAAPPAATTTFYGAQAIGRDTNGNLVQMDDTAKAEFLGFTIDFVRTQVDPIDTVQTNGLVGDKMFDVVQPLMFTVLIAAAVAGDEGRKVYWQFNNQVSYTPGSSGNFAGMVWFVKDSTHVTVVPPWMIADLLGSKANMVLPAVANTVLTKFDLGKTFQCPSTAAQSVTLPPAAKCGSGDTLILLQTGSNASQVTVKPSGADTINSTAGWAAATYLLGTAQGSRNTFQTDGISQWFVVG